MGFKQFPTFRKVLNVPNIHLTETGHFVNSIIFSLYLSTSDNKGTGEGSNERQMGMKEEKDGGNIRKQRQKRKTFGNRDRQKQRQKGKFSPTLNSVLGLEFSVFVSWKAGSTVTIILHGFDEECTQRSNIIDKHIILSRASFIIEEKRCLAETQRNILCKA